jgi:integrase
MERGKNPLSADLGNILEFLSSLRVAGKAYNTINVHRSMLSMTLDSLEGGAIGEHPLVIRLMKACYNKNPPQPKYTVMWSPDKILLHLTSLGSNDSLPLPVMTRKAVTLVALASFMRVAEIAAINLKSLVFSQDAVHFSLSTLRKTQRSGSFTSLSIKKFENPLVCPVEAIRSFVSTTAAFRSGSAEEKLWVSVRAPHGPVSSNTIARWIKTVMKDSGIDTDIFSAHSTRSAASSQAAKDGWSIESILKTGSWARESTFNRFYNRSGMVSSAAADITERENGNGN